MLYLKGSGLDWRLLAYRQSIVNAGVTQFTSRETVGGHLLAALGVTVKIISSTFPPEIIIFS